MSGRDWSKVAAANRMNRNGVEPVARPSSRDALQRQANALLAAAPQNAFDFAINRSSAAATRSPTDLTVPPGLVIYADGCCVPNPGVGGWGFVAYRDGLEFHSEHGGDLVATNQSMELTAALRALEWIVRSGQDGPPPRLLSDSRYTIDGCNSWREGWKRNGWRRGGPNAKPQNARIANLELWQALDAALTEIPITLEWCKGHAGIVGNERADELSLIGRDSVLALEGVRA